MEKNLMLSAADYKEGEVSTLLACRCGAGIDLTLSLVAKLPEKTIFFRIKNHADEYAFEEVEEAVDCYNRIQKEVGP